MAVADLGWRDGKRDRRYFYGATPEEATEKRLRFASRRLDGFTMPKGRPPYVGEWMLHWLHNVVKDRVQETTWQKSYRQKVEDHIAPWFARVRLTNDDLTEELVEQWHRDLRAKVSGTTAQHCHRLLSAGLKQAVIRGRLVRNPAANVPAPARSTVEVAPPDEAEILAVLAVCAGEAGRDSNPQTPIPERSAGPGLLAHTVPDSRTAYGFPASDGSAESSGGLEFPGPEFKETPQRLEPWRTGTRWVTGIATGIRQGEALGLLWPHVDLEAGTLAVEWELARLPWQHGCGDVLASASSQHARPAQVCAGPLLGGAVPDHSYPLETKRRSARPVSRAIDDSAPCGRSARSCPQRHSGGLRLKRPKTPASRAQVPLAPFAVAALKRWRAGQKAERLAHPSWTGWACECGQETGHSQGQKPDQNRVRAGQAARRRGQLVCPDCGKPARPDLLVFTQPSGRPVDPRRDWQDWQDLLAAAGLPPSRVHDLRHALGTMLLEAGQDVRVVQELLRHSNPNTTRSIYQHVRQRLKAQGADVIERAYGGNPASGATTRTI